MEEAISGLKPKRIRKAKAELDSRNFREGLDELLTLSRLGLPIELRRSLACTNIIENMNGTVRRVSHNVKRWRDASMALRWTAAGMMEAAKWFRRLKARDQLPTLRDALQRHHANHFGLDETSKAA